MMTSSSSAIPDNAVEREMIAHDVESTSLIKSGRAILTRYDLPDEKGLFLVAMTYEIKAQPWIPKKGADGRVNQKLPIMFASEEGYRMLVEEGSLEDDDVRLQFLGHETVGKLEECYKVSVVPKKRNTWDGTLWYHPSVPGIGWAKVAFTLRQVPLVGSLSATTHWDGTF